MSAPSKTYTIQSVKVRPEERLATTSELNSAPGGVTCYREARGTGCWAVTQVHPVRYSKTNGVNPVRYPISNGVKGLSPEITIVSKAETVHDVEGSSLIAAMRGDENPTGSETTARHQMESVGTWDAHDIPVRRVSDNKPINGKESPMMSWESDQFIVAMKPRNGGGAKGLAAKPLERGHIAQTLIWDNNGNRTLSTIPILLGEVSLKSRMREICTSGSVRGFIVNSYDISQRRWL